MIISNSFRKFYFGGIISDIRNQLDVISWNGIRFNIKKFSNQDIHELFKIFTSNNKSLKDMNSKEVCNFIEEIRLIGAENGITLEVDDEEWERIIKGS